MHPANGPSLFSSCSALAAFLDTEHSIGTIEERGVLRLRLNGGWTGLIAGTSPTRADWELGHIMEDLSVRSYQDPNSCRMPP